MLRAISGLSGLFFLGCNCATSSTTVDPQIEVPGTHATGTLSLGPLWVPDVPGLVLGPSCGLLGLKTELRCLFCYSLSTEVYKVNRQDKTARAAGLVLSNSN